MRTKIDAILLCIFSATVGLTFGGCSLFEPPAPTEEHVIAVVKDWGVPFPEDITIINYALDAGIQDGEWFYVLEYNGNNEEFINYLSNEEENEIAGVFEKCIEDLEKKGKFYKPYEMPDLSDGYYWLYEGRGDDILIDYKFYMLYIPSACQILIYRIKI